MGMTKPNQKKILWNTTEQGERGGAHINRGPDYPGNRE